MQRVRNKTGGSVGVGGAGDPFYCSLKRGGGVTWGDGLRALCNRPHVWGSGVNLPHPVSSANHRLVFDVTVALAPQFSVSAPHNALWRCPPDDS